MANQNTPSTPSSIPLPKSKRGLKGYWTEVGREMKKVTWPTRHETTRLTGVVLAVCVMVMGILFLLGEAFHYLIKLVTEGF